MTQWRTLAREEILDERPWLTVERHTIALPDGRIIDNWAWVTTPDFVIVVAITTENKYLCFRQMKYALPEGTLAVVGGYIGDGEEPLLAAQRELREETGYEAGEWIEMGQYCLDPNRGVARGHLFLARGAHWVTEIDSDDLEPQELIEMEPEAVRTAMRAGEFSVMSWTAALALSFLYE